MKSNRLLVVLVLLCLASNFLISLLAINKVKRSSRDYVVTEAAFINAVTVSTTNFLSQVRDEDKLLEDSQPSKQSTVVSVKYIDDMTIYYRPRLSQWVIRFNGCDFLQGDYFDDGVLLRIMEGRAYCKSSEGLIVLRPRVRPVPSLRQEGRPGRTEGETDALL